MRLWYPFYPRDYMIDTMTLSLEQDCTYRRLIDLYYTQGGPIELDYKPLSKLLRIHPIKLRGIMPSLFRYFKVVDGRLHHERIDAEIAKAIEIQEKKAKAGKKGGLAKAKHVLETLSSTCSSKAQSQSHIQKDLKEKSVKKENEKLQKKTKKTDSNNKIFKEIAVRIIDFLNKKAGKKFQHLDVNHNFIIARLKDNATEAELKMVIAMKVRESNDNNEKFNRKYLRPATLFNAEKYAQYTGELG